MAEQLSWIFENYGSYERSLSSLMITVAMLGVGASLTPRDFAGVFIVWKAFAVGMFTQILLVPLWAGVLLALIAQIPAELTRIAPADGAGIALGIALLSAMPGGSMSNLLTFLARGNVALSVTLTAFTTCLCLVVTPVVVKLLVTFQIPGTIEIEALHIVLDIALYLVAPLLVGMVIGRYLKQRRQRFTSIMVNASLVLLALIVAGSLGAGRVDFPRYGWYGPVIIVIFCLCITQIAKYTARFSGLHEGDCVTLNIEASIKNVLLALLLITTMFPLGIIEAQDPVARAVLEAARDGCTFTILVYGAACLVCGAVTVIQYRVETAIAVRRAARGQ